MPVEAKICGINSRDALRAAIAGGARYAGFNFYRPSPRYVTPREAAKLAIEAGTNMIPVGVFVDEDDETFEAVLSAVSLEILQLHGHESPDRVRQLKARFGVPVMKAIPVATRDDLDRADHYLDAADHLLFDAKPPKNMKDALPGGNALTFDWRLLAGHGWPLPWILSGGLDSDNVAEAIRITGARAVDVSSGVERRQGLKDPARIAAFLAAVQATG